MTRRILTDGTTGEIALVIFESDPAIAALYADYEYGPANPVVMTLTSDTGAHIQTDVVKVDVATGGIVTIAGGDPVSEFDGSIAEQIETPE